MQALTFKNTQFDIVDREGQPWLRLPQIGVALGYASPYKVQQVYDRNADEFTDRMTSVVELETAGGKQLVRIFSLRGAHLLGMLSRTKVAKEFRAWVLDVLEGVAEAPTRKQIEHMPLSIAHQKALRSIIAKRAKGNRRAFSLIYNILYEAFDVPRYQEIPDSQFSEAVAIASAVSLQAIEGELMEPATAPEVDIDAAQVITLSAKVARHRWHQLDQLSEELVRISQQIRDVRSNLYDPLFGTAGFIPKLTHGEGVTDNQVQSFIEMQNRCRAR